MTQFNKKDLKTQSFWELKAEPGMSYGQILSALSLLIHNFYLYA